MTDPANFFLENPAASVFGLAGLACQLTWPLFSRRRTMLGVQIGIGANYGTQYLLLNAWSGAGICALGAIQTAIALFAGNRSWLRYLGVVFFPILAMICVVTWNGASSLLACGACALVMVGRLQQDTLKLRGFMLAAAPFGISYDLCVDADVALAGAVISAAVSATAFVREFRSRRGPALSSPNALPGQIPDYA